MASLMQSTWTWANSSRWRGIGRPEELQSLGSQSRGWLSDWTTTLVVTWLFWTWTKFLLYEGQCIQSRPHRAVSESYTERPSEQGQRLTPHVSLPKSNTDVLVDLARTCRPRSPKGHPEGLVWRKRELYWEDREERRDLLVTLDPQDSLV